MNRIFGILVAFMLVAQPAMAATLYLDPASATLARGDAEVLAVRLDTDEAQDECINAVEGVLSLEGPIAAVDVSLGNSIFSIWVEPPTISQNGKQVTFAGGIPNGYCGRIAGDPRLTNTLFEIIARTDAIASVDGSSVPAQVSFTEQTIAYLNDGFGTPAELQVFPQELTVLPQLSADVQDPWKERVRADTTDPQEFSIALDQIRNRYFITFNTTDKQTGIDRYEVMEEPLSNFSTFTWGSASAPWIETRSPYELDDQTLNSVIRVKAIDKAGNEYIATFVPDEALRTVPVTQVLLVALLSFSVLVLLFGLVRFYKRKQREREEKALQRAFGEPDKQPNHPEMKHHEVKQLQESQNTSDSNHEKSH
jgi:hypothetical protein